MRDMEETMESIKEQFEYTEAVAKRDKAAVAIDYETFYDTKAGYSLSKMPTLKYCTDSRFDAYLVAICGWEIFDDGMFCDDWKEGETLSRRMKDRSIFRKLPDGRQLYIGRPEKFSYWENLKGRMLLAHNAGFDSVVTDVLAKNGILPKFLLQNEWNCTADMSVYLAAPRNLKGAMEYLEGKHISKDVRAGMDGRTVYQLNENDLSDLYEYGGSDAVECHDLWLHWAKEWPLLERAISRQKRESIKVGVKINVEYAQRAKIELSSALLRAEAQIPWFPEFSAQSSTALKKQLLSDGYTLPKSFAKKSAVYMKWVEKNGTIPYVKARQDHASINMHAKRVENIINTVDENGFLHPPFKYFGAHTGRDSGNAKEDETSRESSPAVNMLNMAKKPVLKGNPEVFGGAGVDMRGMIIPRPGYVFAIYDYSQIEARHVLWAAGDTEFFELMKTEFNNLYQTVGVRIGLFDSKGGTIDLKHTDPDKYQLNKQIGLGKGYGMGPATFVIKCKEGGFEMPSAPVEEWPDIKQSRRLMFMIRNQLGILGDPYDEENRYAVGQLVYSERIHQMWRAANPKVVAMWQELADIFARRAQQNAPTVAYRLPSGRIKRYFNPKLQKVAKIVINEDGKREERVETALSGQFTRAGERKFLNGGKLCENLTQASCRDIMAYAAIEIERVHPTWRYVWSVYDEIVVEVPIKDSDLAQEEIPRIMTHGELISDWTEGLPLEVEGGIFERYTK